MNRRDLLKFLISTPIASVIDYEKLLWIPGEKTIFIPSPKGLTATQILALELERILPGLEKLFQRDDSFYKVISQHKSESITGREFRIPLQIKIK